MALNGVRTTDLPALNAADDVIANSAGTTGTIPFATLVALINATTGPTYALLADLDADLVWADGVLATVWGETDDSLNGIYQKFGASSTGAWGWVRPLPLTTLGAALLKTKANETDLAALRADVAALAVGLSPAGAWDASSGAFPADAAEGTFYVVSIAGTVDGQTFAVGDWLIALVTTPATAIFAGNWTRADYSEVVAAALIDPPVFKVGDRAATSAQLNTLSIATGGHVSDGGRDYGLTIEAFEPGICLVDRSVNAGQSLIKGDAAQIALCHDPVNNDGTIGFNTNTDTVISARFRAQSQRFYADGEEKLVLDADGLRLDGQKVVTEQSFPITQHKFNNPPYTGADPISRVFIIENLALEPGTYLIEVHGAFTYSGPGGSQQSVDPVCFDQFSNANLIDFDDFGSGAFEQRMLSNLTTGLLYCTAILKLNEARTVKVGFSQGSFFSNASHTFQVFRPRVTIQPARSLNP
ncbi:hypothetical protein [Cognatiyoonia sp. IB215182]|uniref:hypothetical protein n=1 Tax=Cognatiyoonia sp. IB215182 TaxID=3097353 RepID=UPI002A16C3D2|nr:hypothetical protein [Cognatiyoonia sp. IB215182]MDX8354366.1 hypothetical protein [Cognatiyoonia sp. IB215182]